MAIYKYEEKVITTKEVEILPCPFCGYDNVRPHHNPGSHGYSPSEDYVSCGNCKTIGPIIRDDNGGDHMLDVINKWNKRAKLKIEKAVEAEESCLEKLDVTPDDLINFVEDIIGIGLENWQKKSLEAHYGLYMRTGDRMPVICYEKARKIFTFIVKDKENEDE